MYGTSPIDVEKKKLVLKIQSELMRSVRKFLEQKGFLEILSPVFEPFTDSGIGDAEFFEIDYYGKTYKLLSALTIHKPLIVTQFGKFFSFTPCSRKEPKPKEGEAKSDGRHLAQFYQIEVELPGSSDDAMKLLEKTIKYVVEDVKKKCSMELEMLGRDLEVPSIPFKRVTYKEAIQHVQKLGFDIKEGDSISCDVEKALSSAIGEPFFLTSFPKSLLDERGFLYKAKDGDDVLLDFDLIMPEEFGEVSSGSEREFEYEKIVESLRKTGRLSSYKEYLELAKEGIAPTSGFGIGVERLTKFICGLKDVSEASLFPKIPGVTS